MKSNTDKSKPRKSTLLLWTVFIALVLLILTNCLIVPACQNYYVTHFKFKIYGGMNSELKDSELFEDMKSGKSFCFLGDSITAGNQNNGVPWYQPLKQYIKGEITYLSRGGYMVQNLINRADDIPTSDIYLVAIGINDVLIPTAKYASPSAVEYINRLDELAKILKKASPSAKIYFIAPWSFFDQEEHLVIRGEQFRASLIDWCDKTEYICINPHPIISSIVNESNKEDFLIDKVHPNSSVGVGLYSYAVLKADHDRKPSSQQ